MASIIVIDDSRTIRSLAKEYFEEDGHKVTTFAAEIESLEEIHSLSKADIVFTDYDLTKGNATDVLRLLRSEGCPNKKTDVIVISGGTGVARDLPWLWSKGVIAFFTKPLNFSYLSALAKAASRQTKK